MELYILIGALVTGLLLMAPLILEHLNKLYVPIACLALVFVSVSTSAPYSAEARSILLMVHAVPETVMDAISNSQDGVTKLNTTYFTAFR